MRRRVRHLLLVASTAIATSPAVSVQAQMVQATGPLPNFEVATIKPDPGGPGGPGMPPPNVVRTHNASVRDLVRMAYGLPPGPASTRVLGGPGWIDTDRYDVDAKIPDAVFAEMQKLPQKEQRERKLLMLQALLSDRCKLAAHVETREMPISALVVAKGGPKLTAAKPLQPGDDMPPQPLVPGKMPSPADMRHGLMVLPKPGNVIEMVAKGQTLDDLAQTPFFERGPVYNQTGLTGQYDFTLDWTPERSRTSGDAPAVDNAPPLDTALEMQLGLKLIATKGPVEVVVIDHIEHPSEN
jgi:bla regulator protein BlaR1